ncbi:cell division protein FtsZ [Pseudoscardovia radai]|jgi:cell division protein FtsZ|uniref:Cell division protein FtsZ n=1 Tax=Pseudoscardovia radai TaxID=987066 RepID=A0A261EY90_9BIFI|nr:cell division protein FtsZ [Pseudoscardovia radai]OZG51807.1 cell division protein FtsZ [Pseudoscardovia radai]
MSDYDVNPDTESGFDPAGTIIRVVGVGGGGGNAVNRMIDEGLKGVEFVAINTDSKDLARSEADVKITLSDETSRGLGAGGDPEKGAKAAEDHQSDIEEALKGSDMVFVTCGEGGGTGTGASPIVARIARQQGALTIAVVTRPFAFEGKRRAASAETGIENLRKEVDAMITIPNDRLLDLDPSTSFIDAFKRADSTLVAGVRGITDLITNPNPYMNVDFADVCSTLKDAGTALFGIGSAQGDQRCLQAAEFAIASPLLEQGISGAHSVLVSIAGPADLLLTEVSEAMDMISKTVHPEAAITMGCTLDDSFGDGVFVTIVAGGFTAADDPANQDAQDKTAPVIDTTSPVSRPIQTKPVIAPAAAAPVAAPSVAQRPVSSDDTAEHAVYPSQSGQFNAMPPYTETFDDDDDGDEPTIPDFMR